MDVATASEVRADWAQVLRRVRGGRPLTVTQHGDPVAVIVDVTSWHRAGAAVERTPPARGGREILVDATDTRPRSWERLRAELRDELRAEVTTQVMDEIRPHVLGRDTLDRIGALSASDGRTPDQLVNTALDGQVRTDRRRLLRADSRAALADETDAAELRALRDDLDDLRAW